MEATETLSTTPEAESPAPATSMVTGLLWVHPREVFSPLAEAPLTLGRGGDCGVILESDKVSRCHATVRNTGGSSYHLSDLQSRNGTFLNGRQVEQATLRVNDVLRVGDWLGVVVELEEHVAASQTFFVEPESGLLVGPRSRGLWRRLELAAPGHVPIVIEGETGTGKEVVARAIHRLSQRTGRFVGINCAALPETLVEAHLFGHGRGAYTGATHGSEGLIEAAHRGSVLLDEIVDLPLSQQAKLLRVIEEASVLRIGETVPRPIDVRFIAASQRSLWDLLASGAFRADLLGRLSGCTLRLSPLRERREEVPRLFARAFAAAGGDVTRLKATAIEALCLAPWPLNVRQLVLAAQNAAALLPGAGEIGRNTLAEVLLDAEQSLPPARERAGCVTPEGALRPGGRRDRWLARHAQDLDRLRDAIKKNRGNLSAAARVIGISRSAAARLIEADAQKKGSSH